MEYYILVVGFIIQAIVVVIVIQIVVAVQTVAGYISFAFKVVVDDKILIIAPKENQSSGPLIYHLCWALFVIVSMHS